MLTNSTFGQQERKPACSRCGGTGYVYLWSVARAGSRVWFCDRSACKRFWSDARSNVATLYSAVVVPELQPLVSGADQRVPQPV